MRIRELYIYPLKSAAGMRVAEATIDALGFAGDRRWMTVDVDGRFLSQRRIPRMALIQATTFPGDSLFLSAPAAASLRVPRPDGAGRSRRVTVWRDDVDALDAGDDAAEWITSVLQKEARLVYCPLQSARLVDREYASGDERVGFADGFPLLIVGHGTVEEINSRLQAQGQDSIGVNRFRPNIVVEGAEPFAEDSWKALRIESIDGDVEVDIVKPCARCSIISVDPRTGVQGVEPMRTLAPYRRRGIKVYVAQNAIPRTLGRIITGAAVSVR
jgi:uncharacterized protein